MFQPTEIFIESNIKDHPITQRILSHLPDLPQNIVENYQNIKIPEDPTQAKKKLFLNKLQGELIKTCQGQGDVCCQYQTIDLITNCPLDCTYCILQDYLKNNPIITIHTNIEDIFESVRAKMQENPKKIFRVGTGELSDSLALDNITEFSKDCVALANELDNIVFEFKTKTNNIKNLLKLNHKENVVVGWSLNPQKYIETEEFKCASLSERLFAARQCANAGYPISFHFDPLLNFADWKEAYSEIITQLADLFKPKEIAWVSFGSLRFTPGLKKVTLDRFPKSKIMTGELFAMPDGKIRYFRLIREEMYQTLLPLITKKLGKIPHYLCMETKTVWQNVYGFTPTLDEVEKQVAANFLA